MLIMFRSVLLQIAVTITVSVVAGLVVGTRGGVSAAMGGAVCVLPNLLFAVHLKFSKLRPRASFASSFLLGEIVKLVMTFLLLIGVVRYYADLHWPSLLIGLVLATQALFLAFWIKN